VAPDGLPEPIAVAVAFTQVLERLGVPYVIGGSVASSVHGEPRSTNDIDVVAKLEVADIGSLVAAIAPDYYVSETAVRDAVHERGTFNAIHVGTAVKVDVFVAGDEPFEAERLRLRERVPVSADPPVHLFVDTAEHVVLRKLEWFRRGGEASERQWRDVVGVLRARAERLDLARLREWAARLEVSDLLDRALAESRGPMR